VCEVPLNPDFAGRRYPPTEPYEVAREKIREFARAIGDVNPACVDVAAARALGHPDLVAPPTFVIVLTMPAEGQALFDPALGFDFSRVVHRSQRFTHRRPAFAGDRLTVCVEVTGIDTLDGNDVVSLSSEVRSVAGEAVCTATASLLSRA
jgi:acyl dehydratase